MYVEGLVRRRRGLVVAPLDHPPQHVEPPLEDVAVDADGGDEELPDDGHAGAGDVPDDRGIVGDVAPAEQAQPLVLAAALDDRLGAAALLGVGGEEDHAHAVGVGRGKVDARGAAQEGVGDLHQDARAVTGLGIAPAGAAVAEVDERLEAATHDGVRALPCDAGDERHTARVVLESRVVEALGHRSGHLAVPGYAVVRRDGAGCCEGAGRAGDGGSRDAVRDRAGMWVVAAPVGTLDDT